MAVPKTQDTYIIDLPFSFGNNGKVAVIKDTDHKAWKNKVLTLFSIDVDERVWYHNFGANVNNVLFENNHDAIVEARAAIEEAFVRWAPELTLKEVTATVDEFQGSITLSIFYQIPTGELDSVKLSTESLTSSGEIIKVL